MSEQVSQEILDELKWASKEGLNPFNAAIVEYYKKWHKQGRESQIKGFERLNPFAGRKHAIKEYFWMCGYDNVSFEKAFTLLDEKMKEIERSSTSLVNENLVTDESVTEEVKA